MTLRLTSLLLATMLPLALFATEKPTKAQPMLPGVTAPTAAPRAAQALAPIASIPVAPPPHQAPALPALEAAAAPLAAADAHTVTKVTTKREGLFKRKFKQMRDRLNTYVLVGLILVGIGILVAAVASGLLGALFIIAGGVLIILGVV